jgi:hypothetical protein
VELYERIRKDHRDEQLGVRALARRYRVHRRTVREALGSAVPPPRKTPKRESPALGPWKEVIRGWLEAEVADQVPRKQRHTARRVWQRLVEEHDAQVSESAVRGFVAEVRYDNLKAAVLRILVGRDRVENERFIALRSHYGFDAFFCAPGVAGAHEKGGVEGEIGRFRRRHLVPIPEFSSLDELNAHLAAAMASDDERRIGRRARTVGEAFAVEAPLLHPLPDEPFDCARLVEAKVDAKARICVLQSWYSVPVRLARRRVTLRLGARHLEVLDPTSGTVVARHPRSLHKGSQDLDLDHYLEILSRKPGALAGASALAQGPREGRVFTDAHDRFWAAARREHGDAAGTRALIEVLLLHRRMAPGDVVAGIDATLKAGSTVPELVAIEARRLRDATLAPVVPIEAGLGRYDRPVPGLGGYDQLLAAGQTLTDDSCAEPAGPAATVTEIGGRR